MKKCEKGDQLTDCRTLRMPQGSLRQLLNTYEVNDVRQACRLTETTAVRLRWPLERQKAHKSPGTDSIGAELL